MSSVTAVMGLDESGQSRHLESTIDDPFLGFDVGGDDFGLCQEKLTFK